MNSLFKIACYLLLALFILAGGFLYVAGNGVPFIEGDTVVSEGDGYGFRIGMSKIETFEALSDSYNEDDYFVRAIYSDVELPINKLEVMPIHFRQSDRWDILMPTTWVNSIYLAFDDNRLYEIKRSRWLFERP